MSDVPSRRLDAVTFDVGSTLLDDPAGASRRSERRALKHWLRGHGVVEKERLRGVLATAGRAWSGEDVEPSRVAARAADSIVGSLGLRITEAERASLVSLLSDIYRVRPHHAAEGVADALRCLREQGLGLGIVSNRGARPGRFVMRHLEANGLVEFFEPSAIIWSDEVGFSKPDPRIYFLCLQALGVPAERTAHVGDHKLKDVLGARQLGMLTIRYRGIRNIDEDGPEADVVISHFRELASALGLADRASRVERTRA